MCSEVDRTHVRCNCRKTTDKTVANTQDLLIRGCSGSVGYRVKMLVGDKFLGIPIPFHKHLLAVEHGECQSVNSGQLLTIDY